MEFDNSGVVRSPVVVSVPPVELVSSNFSVVVASNVLVVDTECDSIVVSLLPVGIRARISGMKQKVSFDTFGVFRSDYY